MNIYMIINEYHLKNNTNPFLYIGSDAKDRIMIEQYSGSSKTLTSDITRLGLQNFSKSIIWHGDTTDLGNMGFSSLTELEKEIHVWLDVARNEAFYNIVAAGERFSTVGKAVYYLNGDPTKTNVLLPISDPRVVSKEYVGRNTGKVISNETREKLKLRPHPSEFMDWHAIMAGHRKNSTENYRKPKSDAHRTSIKAAIVKRYEDPNYRAKMSAVSGRKTPVIQMAIDGTVIARFSTIKEAADAIGGGNRRCDISACCRGKQHTAYGFKWMYDTSQLQGT